LFQSQSSDSLKENLLIFVTPTIIDPAGNRVHSDEDLPFAKTGIPPQPAPAPYATPPAP
jgi:type II secretory pathway component GspD/PulD (secretin)